MIQPISLSSAEGRRIAADIRNRFAEATDDACREAVTDILARVRREGDAAVLAYCCPFDCPLMALETLRVSAEEFAQAEREVDDEFRRTLRFAADRVRRFHEREMEDSWLLTREDGAVTGRLVRPVDSAGLYVPGGKEGSTPLVSSVLMNGIPAQIAEVGRRVIVTPPGRDGRVNPALLVAAQEIGIDEVYKVGSAWAVAALAYGTATIPRVDVIVGPGNQYVAEAKRQVMGRVRIDMIAGPSEVLIIADGTGSASFAAADLLAQAEHDETASAVLLTPDAGFAQAVAAEVERQLEGLSRKGIASRSLAAFGAAVVTRDLAEAVV
ncbi:MAG TPA: histidinol dehydrogenase, partial [Desulfobacterales bacterium]|nr:histidinol dehydrogenase [Desulfobacterales bacterium]